MPIGYCTSYYRMINATRNRRGNQKTIESQEERTNQESTMFVFSRSLQTIVLVGSQSAAAFQSASKTRPTTSSLNAEAVERRNFLSQAAVTAASLAAVGSFAAPHPASASGGATAGGAYLLSAKQRYNDRVTKGLKGFLALEESLKAGSVKEATIF